MSLSSRAFWRPGGCENLCRLMCHCVRHIGLDNKHGQSVEAIHSFLSRWRAGTELCADKQEEPSGKKGSMGSEKRQKSFRSDLKSVVTLLFPPRFDRAAFKIRRYLPERLLFLPSALPVCRHRAPCKPSNVIGTSVSLRRIDRACYQDR